MAYEAQMEVWSKPAWLHGRRRQREQELAATQNGEATRDWTFAVPTSDNGEVYS
jgi:hypothetical protein